MEAVALTIIAVDVVLVIVLWKLILMRREFRREIEARRKARAKQADAMIADMEAWRDRVSDRSS